MYSRSFYPETNEQSIPENYVGTAFSEKEIPEAVSERISEPEPAEIPASVPATKDGFLSSFTKLPFLSGLFSGDGKLLKMPKIGSEEILIIGIAALMFFSVDGDKAVFTPEYYLMKHFSHFVKRGAKYVTMKGEMASDCTCFKNPDGGYVLVIDNPYKEPQVVTVMGKSYELKPRSINTITF